MDLGCLQPVLLHCLLLPGLSPLRLPEVVSPLSADFNPEATTGASHFPELWPELSSALLLPLTPSQPSTNMHFTADFIFPWGFLEASTSCCHQFCGDSLALPASGQLTSYFPESLFSIHVVHKHLQRAYSVPGQTLESLTIAFKKLRI